ncbi:MAG: hypothetical protein AAGF88_05335 [Pseudomonadota bacterium]
MVRLLVSLAFLIACNIAQAQGTMQSRHTGLVGGYSAELRVSQHRHFTVYAQGFVIRNGDTLVHTVFLTEGTNQRPAMRVDSAWHLGRELHWDAVRPDRRCSGFRCVRNLGVLTFSGGEFNALSATGFDLRLIGSQGPIDLVIPAEIFAQASTEAARVIGASLQY